MTADAVSLRRRLAAGGHAVGLESAGEGPDLGRLRRERSLDALSDLIHEGAAEAGADGPAAGLLDAAREGLDALEAGAQDLAPHLGIALEALVLADGSRPAVLVRDDRVDPEDRSLGAWKSDLRGAGTILRDIARGCGRVTVTGEVGARCVGTAFAVAEGLVATNRHVLQAVADPDGAGGWVLRPGTAIDFGAEDGRDADPDRIHLPDHVTFAGPDPIGAEPDLALLDLALITLRDEGGRAMPPPLPLSDDPAQIPAGSRIAVMGHPAAPARGSEDEAVLFRLFRGRFDVKRLAPGLVTSGLGALEGDHCPPRCFGHDASTLGGNSGSCIVALDGTWDVVGLHFGGRQRVENFAHALAVIGAAFPDRGAQV